MLLHALVMLLISTVVEATAAAQKQAGWIKQVITPTVLTMLLTVLVFLLILVFGLNNMLAIKTPVQFADKSLVLNKEY